MPVETYLEPEAIGAFSEEARRAVYDCIALRRDIRHFRPDVALDNATLTRILEAAQQAPSVGFSQPSGFIVIRDRGLRERVRQSFLACREAEANRFPEERRTAYLAHKLEGICEASLNLCVVVDLRDREEVILGTTVQPEAVRASACCAVENLWLAARAEGIGVGWVSIVEPAVLRRELALPAGVEPIAYLCLGHPIAFRRRPMLEETGWGRPVALDAAVHWEGRWREEALTLRQEAALPAPAAPVERAVPPACSAAKDAARAHQATLTKPVGSLGRLEELAMFYAGAHRAFPAPALDRGALALFVADHGIAAQGVSAYGSTLSAAMTANVMSGGAAVCAIADDCRVDILLTDVGIAGDLSALPITPRIPLRRRRIRAGTGDLSREPAMTRAEAESAMAVGAETALSAINAGSHAIAIGEIGIGNTTAAAALVSAFTGIAPALITGRGTGISAAAMTRKVALIERALALHRPDPRDDAIGVLAALGGLEIAAMVGCLLEAARRGVPVILDGLVTNAAALVASGIEPNVRGYLIAAHESTEPGARAALAELQLVPLLELDMRLGEGTGACLGLALLRTAVLTQRSMATFASAGIVGRAGIEPRLT